MPSYSESATSGSSQFALAYSSKTTSTDRIEIGLWLDRTSMFTNGNPLTLRARAAWAHDSNTDRSATAAFQSLPGTSFIVNGAPGAQNLTLLSAGAEAALGKGWLADGTFDGEFSCGTAVYGGTLKIRRIW